MTRKKIATIGDAMIVFNPSKTGPLRFVPSFDRSVGGAELNFAIGVSRLGLESKWISCLGNDEFGTHVFNFARGEGIDVSQVNRTEKYPTSIYFKEISESGTGKSFYYRQPSPLLDLTVDSIGNNILDDVDLLHISGVYLAVSSHNIDVAVKLMEIAKQMGIPITFDPNLRLKLWRIEEAKLAYEQVYPFVSHLLTGDEEFELLFGRQSVEAVLQQYDFKEIVIKKGANGAAVTSASQHVERNAYTIQSVDSVGAGDAFDSAYVYGLLNHFDIEERLRFANGSGALVATVKGDNEGLPSLTELKQFIGDEKIVER